MGGMEPTTQFATVGPAPFAFAQAPGSFMGRSVQPNLPPVGGYSREDLERMRFALAQSGADPAMLGRIDEVIALRRAGEPPLMLQPTSAKMRRVAAPPAQQAGAYNPFAVVGGMLGQPQ